MFRDGDNRVRRGVGLTVKPTLLSLDASIADVPIKHRRSEVQFDGVSNILMPLANVSPNQALRSCLYDLDLRSCACHSVDTCTMIFNDFTYQHCPYGDNYKFYNYKFYRLKINIEFEQRIYLKNFRQMKRKDQVF